MAKSSFPAYVTAVVISVAVVLALSMQTINASEEDPVASFTWTPEGCAFFNNANDGSPIPVGSTIELINTGVHRAVSLSECDCNAGKVDNPIAILGQNQYGVTIITVDEPGMYCVVSDLPGDIERGYKITFLVGNTDCPKVNQD